MQELCGEKVYGMINMHA